VESALNAITAANVGDVLKSIFDGASEELQEADNLKMFVPKAVKLLYDEWFLAHFGAVNYNSSYGRKWLHGTDDHCEIVALSGQKNSPYIYLTTKNNMLVGCDQESNKSASLCASRTTRRSSSSSCASSGASSSR
jgi:hypothetical protein